MGKRRKKEGKEPCALAQRLAVRHKEQRGDLDLVQERGLSAEQLAPGQHTLGKLRVGADLRAPGGKGPHVQNHWQAEHGGGRPQAHLRCAVLPAQRHVQGAPAACRQRLRAQLHPAACCKGHGALQLTVSRAVALQATGPARMQCSRDIQEPAQEHLGRALGE